MKPFAVPTERTASTPTPMLLCRKAGGAGEHQHLLTGRGLAGPGCGARQRGAAQNHAAARVGPGAAAVDHGAQPNAAGRDLLSAAAFAPVHELVAGCGADCSGHSSGLLVLCLAVLLTVVGTASLRRLNGARPLALDADSPPHVRARATVPRRRLDLVADLCISRT